MRIVKIVHLLGVMALLFFSCSSKNKEREKENIGRVRVSAEERETKFQNSHDTGTYKLFVDAENRDEGTIFKIYTEGLQSNYGEAFEVEGKIVQSYMLDLNNDGKHEFYLVVEPIDDSGRLDILAIAFEGDSHFSSIAIQDIYDERDIHTDKLEVKNGMLFRSFRKNGDFYYYTYDLKQGEAAKILKAKKIDTIPD